MTPGRSLRPVAVALWAASLLLAASCARAGASSGGPGCRKHVAKVTEYGAVGDGRTLNTAAFARAVADLSRRARDGGAALVVPPGKWLTGPFNLTSCFTLYLDEGAEILASQVAVALWAASLLLAAACARAGASSGGPGCRKHVAKVTEYGAVGDGRTLNTAAFARAVADLSRRARDGGAALVVPPGKWLTGPFNLTSCFTLYLDEGAEILASQDMNHWPLIAPLPSYGRGRDEPGPRYINFIGGSNLTDVIITGKNGTINGQGQVWWDKFHAKELKSTRGHLLELLYSDNIIISNVTFINAPFWNLHPTYCTNVTISGVTILAPLNSPNTDGIDPDSSSHVKIEDCYIISGDDCVAVKSGWDEYGIRFNMPSQHIVIRRLTCISPTSAMIALGSEMSGGIRDVRAEDNVAINTESAVRVKSGAGRGGFVRDIFVRGLSLHTMKWVFWMTGNYGQHPDNTSNPNAMPEVTGINYSDVFAENVTMAGRMEGIPNDPYTGICISNVTARLAPNAQELQWNCTNVKGVTSDVSPKPCPELGAEGKPCAFPVEELVIGPPELPKCSY